MRETNKRIKEYQKMLPHMKERVTAVLLLLAISVAMMTSATFAWMTLSRSPEVSSIATTITTNGSLEIALSGEDGKQPGETAIGDGALDLLTRNLTWGNLINLSDPKYGLNDIVLRPASLNKEKLATDPMYAVQYGPDGRVLGYLYDFKYTNYVENENGIMYFKPEADIKYGVRAISTVTFSNVDGDAIMIRKIEEIESSLISARMAFKDIYDIDNSAVAKRYMTAVGGLVGVHVDKTMNGGSPDASAHMSALYDLANAFLLCVVDAGEVMVEAANLCVFMADRDNYDTKAFTFEDLINGTLTNEEIEVRCDGDYDVNFTCFDDFRLLWKKMAGYDNEIKGVNEEWSPVNEDGTFVEKLTLPAYASKYNYPTSNSNSTWGAYEVILAKYQNYYDRVMKNAEDQTVPWDNWMLMAVNQMCDVDSATIRAGNNEPMTAAQLLQAKADRELGKLTPFTGNGPFYAVIHDGAIQDIGQLLSQPMEVPSNPAIRIKASVLIASLNYNFKIDMQPSISTAFDAEGNVLSTDVEEAKRVASGGSDYKGIPTAAETYAMVFDFWVRTNARDALLTLEGELIYDQLPGTDKNGVQKGLLYSYTETDTASGDKVTHYVYWDQDQYYYDYVREGKDDMLTIEQVAAIKEELQPVYADKPSGYQGVNRVWDELNNPENVYAQQVLQNNGTSTTQGSGSCYIFYPQSPEDQAQSLDLLAAMRVAFVDENGKLLTTAYMDTSTVVEDAGRVIVPLRLRTNDNPLVDSEGVTIDQYITPLYCNEAKRISAIVYLEGDGLTNSEVLAAGSITGQMNIQFGTTDLNLNALEDQEVMKQYYTFDFSLDGDRDGVAEVGKEYNIPENVEPIIDLTLNLGDAAVPRTVEGNFVSVINATQGAGQDTFIMRQNENGLWEAYHYVENEDPTKPGTYVKGILFNGPGNYQLRSIRIDGVDYTLNDDQIIKIQVPGISIGAVRWNDLTGADAEGQHKSYRTADVTKQEVLRLVLQRSDNYGSGFSDVRGIFLGDNGQNVAVQFSTTNGTDYIGTATFLAGGHYEMTYVYVDGTVMRLDPQWYKTIDLQLGLKVEIGYTAPKFVVNGGGELTQEQMDEILKDLKISPQSCYFRYNMALAAAQGVHLEIDVWCKIYDDQDNKLTSIDLASPALYFGTGLNGLDTDLVWSEDNEGCYKGTFRITSNGMYRFSYVELSDGSAISRAIAAPTFTSASAYAVEYVHNRDFYDTDLIYDLGLPANQRVLQFKLKNSLGAAVKVALSNTPTGAATFALTRNTPEPIIVSNVDGWNNQGVIWKESQPDANGVVTYTLQLPRDGYWEIAGLYLGGGAYYGGELWSGETEEDWADLSELILSDKIGTYYLTEVVVETNDLPNVEKMNIEFMQRITSTGSANRNVYRPTIALKNQGRPLADVLAELVAAGHNIDTAIDIQYYYTYSQHADKAWTVSDTSKLPTTLAPTANANGVDEIAFLVDGVYTPHFSITIGGEPYTGALPEELSKVLRVFWTMPDVQITGVSDQGSNINVQYTSSENDIAAVKNYYENHYATVYHKFTGKVGVNFFAEPSVQLTAVSGKGAATSVAMTVSSSNFNTTYTLNAGNSWTESKKIGSTEWAGAQRNTAGTVTAKTVVLSDGAANYTFTLPASNQITILNTGAPHVLTLQTSSADVSLPNQVECINYKGETFKVSTNGAKSVLIFSPDGRKFTIKLPTLTRVVEGRIDDLTQDTYDADYNNGEGTAVNAYMHCDTSWRDGCDTAEGYINYQRYEYHVTKTGTRNTYTDTYTLGTWSAGTAGTTVTVDKTMTISTTGTATLNSQLVSSTELADERVTYYKYKLIESQSTTARGTWKSSEDEIGPREWTLA